MNLKSAFSLLAAGMFLVACGADEVVNINDEAKEKATITLKVMDNHDGSAVAGASIYSAVDEKTAATDENGLSIWKKQVLGDHVFRVSKDGYASILVEVFVDEKGQGNVARVPDVVQPVYMYKTGVSAKGTVLYTDDQGNKKAVEGATVFATIDPANNPWLVATFDQTEFSTKTDKNGEYSFKDLPEGVVIDISVGQKEIDKSKYVLAGATQVGGQTYRAGDAINVPLVSMVKNAAALSLVSTNLSKVDTNTTLSLTFSTDLAADSIKGKWFVENENGSDVLVTVALTDKRTITIKPASGKWTKGEEYEIYGVAYSTEGSAWRTTALANGLEFTPGSGSTAKAPEQVTKFKAAYDDTSSIYPKVAFSWTSPKANTNVTAYRLYYQTDKMNDIEQYGSDISIMNITDNTYSERQDYFLDYGTEKKITFILVPCVGSGTTRVCADATKAEKVSYTVVTAAP